MPSVVDLTDRFTVVVAPLAKLPRLQTITLLETTQGAGTESSVKTAGSGSESTTFVAVDGPPLVTTRLNVRLLVVIVTPGDAVLKTARSAAGRIAVTREVELLAGSGSVAALVTIA